MVPVSVHVRGYDFMIDNFLFICEYVWHGYDLLRV